MSLPSGGGYSSKSRNPWSLKYDGSSSSSGSGSSGSSHHHRHDGPMSKQRAAALEIVAAFNRNNIETQTIASFRAPNFTREVLPASLNQTPQDAEGFQRTLNMYRAVFRHYALDVLEVVDDVPGRKVCLWLTARADTVGGKYACDMIWTLTFDETGTKVVLWREFLDAAASPMDYLPENIGV